MAHFTANVSSGNGNGTVTITPSSTNGTDSDISETVTITLGDIVKTVSLTLYAGGTTHIEDTLTIENNIGSSINVTSVEMDNVTVENYGKYSIYVADSNDYIDIYIEKAYDKDKLGYINILVDPLYSGEFGFTEVVEDGNTGMFSTTIDQSGQLVVTELNRSETLPNNLATIYNCKFKLNDQEYSIVITIRYR